MDFSELLGTAASIVAIASLAGLGLIRGTVTNLRENLKDQRDENLDLRRRLADRDAEKATLQADLAATQRMKTGRDEIVAIGEKLDMHHQLAMTGQTKILEFVQAALERLDVVSSALSTMVDKIIDALRRNKL